MNGALVSKMQYKMQILKLITSQLRGHAILPSSCVDTLAPIKSMYHNLFIQKVVRPFFLNIFLFLFDILKNVWLC